LISTCVQIASEQQIIREVPVEKEDSDDEVKSIENTSCLIVLPLQSPKPVGLAPAQTKKTRKISTAVYR
jgi:hypothetical protein